MQPVDRRERTISRRSFRRGLWCFLLEGEGDLAEYDRILVTGANGFIGSHLVEALLARGYRVRCLVRRESDLRFIKHLPVEWAYADVRDAEGLRQACLGVDAVCHGAGLTRALSLEAFRRVNTQGTVALARACLEVNPGLKRFLFISSQAVVGPSRAAGDFVNESRPPRPLDWYGRSKWEAEQELHALGERLPLVVVRPSSVFGPRDRDFLAYFRLVARGLSLQLGRTERRISLIYVGDLVTLLLLALEREVALGRTYLACAWDVSYTELSAAIAQALGKRPLHLTLPLGILTPLTWAARLQERLTHKPVLLNEQRIRNMRQPYWLCSGERAKRELGFAPAYDLATAVQETADWYRSNGWV